MPTWAGKRTHVAKTHVFKSLQGNKFDSIKAMHGIRQVICARILAEDVGEVWAFVLLLYVLFLVFAVTKVRSKR